MMAGRANFDVIEFFHGSKRHLRVYYQYYEDRTLREACYREDYGWFVRGDGVVTRLAKSSSRIAATRWLDDIANRKICVFHLDDKDQICWCHTDSDLSTPWVSGIISDMSKVEVEPSSGIAISLPDNVNQPPRLFFQEKVTGAAGQLRELRYNYTTKEWQLQSGIITADALKGTHLSAASDNLTNALRLYYQASDLALYEVACDRNYRWGRRLTIQTQLISQAPMSVVSWDSGQPVPEIRVFTVTAAASRQLCQLSYTFPNWKSETISSPGYRGLSGIATCRITGPNVTDHTPVFLFHQPLDRAIALTLLPADKSPGSRLLASKIVPLATIPTSLDGPSGNSTGSEEEEKKKDAELEKLRAELTSLTAQVNAVTAKADRDRGRAVTEAKALAALFNQGGSISKDDLSVLHFLYSRGIDINGSSDSIGTTGLIYVIQRGYEPAVSFLLRQGADCRVADSVGNTPLTAACRGAREGIVRALLEKGAIVTMADGSGEKPLHLAVKSRETRVVELLLDNGASIEIRNAAGSTPLHSAVYWRNKSMVSLLVRRGANFNARNLEGNTPLSNLDDLELVQLLVNAGANVNNLNNYGLGIIHYAAYTGLDSILSYLIRTPGANVDVEGSGNTTPLHVAVRLGQESSVRLLLAAGADRNRKFQGNTPLEAARMYKKDSIVRLLE